MKIAKKFYNKSELLYRTVSLRISSRFSYQFQLICPQQTYLYSDGKEPFHPVIVK